MILPLALLSLFHYKNHPAYISVSHYDYLQLSHSFPISLCCQPLQIICQFYVHPFGFISPSLNSLSSYISPFLPLLCISPSLSHQLYLFSLPQSIAPSLPPPFPTPAPQPSHHSPNASHCPQPPTCHYCHLAMLAFPLQPSHSPSSDVPPPIHITTTPIFCPPSLSTPPKRPSSHH